MRNPIEGAELAFSTSREATDCLVSSILLQDDFDQTLHKTKMREARKNHEENKMLWTKINLMNCLQFYQQIRNERSGE